MALIWSVRLARNSCYESNRTSIWVYFDMSEIIVEEQYREGRSKACSYDLRMSITEDFLGFCPETHLI